MNHINATGRWRKNCGKIYTCLSTAISAPHVNISGGKAKVNAVIKKMLSIYKPLILKYLIKRWLNTFGYIAQIQLAYNLVKGKSKKL